MEQRERCIGRWTAGIDKGLLRRAAVSVLLWGAAVYFYAFLNFTVSHDSLNEFIADYDWKISLGRFLAPVYQEAVRGGLAMPWLIGVLSLAFLSLTVYALARLTGLRSAWTVFLTAGVVTAMPSTFLIAVSYIHDLDSNMLALLLSVLAVCAWRTGKRPLLLLGAGLVTAALGLYQSYLSVTVTGVMLLSLLDLLEGKTAKAVFLRGMEAVLMVGLGALVYGAALKIISISPWMELHWGSYNSVTNVLRPETLLSLDRSIAGCYRDFWAVLTRPHFGHGDGVSAAQCVLFAAALGALAYRAICRRVRLSSVLLMVALLAVLPLGVNLSLAANAGEAHDLMRCGFICVYLLALLLLAPLCACGRSCVRRCAVLALACLTWTLWQNVVDANQCLIKKELGRQATAAVMNNVARDMERQESYIPGETPVLFTDVPPVDTGLPESMDYLEGYTGVWKGEQIRDVEQYKKYFRYILQRGVTVCSLEEYSELLCSGAVGAMPAYPQEGYMQMMDGVLVVKMAK